jgi:hypothetical protein
MAMVAQMVTPPERRKDAADQMRHALKIVISVAKEAHAAWDADNDSRVGKILMALSGYRPGYRADIDAIHATLALADEEDR